MLDETTRLGTHKPAAFAPGNVAGAPAEARVEHWEDLSQELWQVQHGQNEMRLMTLDELDVSFRRDEITARTLVRRPGSADWRTLAEIAGLEDESGEELGSEDLESERLLPTSSEVELVAIPPPPRLPTLAAPRRETQASLESIDAGFSALAATDADLERGGSADEDVDPEGDTEAARRQSEIATGPSEIVLSTGELRTARPRRIFGKVTAAMLVAATCGVLFAGASAWLSGALSTAKIASMFRASPPAQPATVAAAAPVVVADARPAEAKPADPAEPKVEAKAEAAPPAAPSAAPAPVTHAAASAPVTHAAAPAQHAPVQHAPLHAAAPPAAKAQPPAAHAHAPAPAPKPATVAHAPAPKPAPAHAPVAHATAHAGAPALARVDAKKGFTARPLAPAKAKAH
jgi:hypothetical protein